MTKTWTMAQAAKVVFEKKNWNDIAEIGEKFPLVLSQLAQLNEAGVLLCSALSDKVTVRKVEKGLQEILGISSKDSECDPDGVESEEAEEEVEPEVKEEPKKKKKKKTEEKEEVKEKATTKTLDFDFDFDEEVK